MDKREKEILQQFEEQDKAIAENKKNIKEKFKALQSEIIKGYDLLESFHEQQNEANAMVKLNAYIKEFKILNNFEVLVTEASGFSPATIWRLDSVHRSILKLCLIIGTESEQMEEGINRLASSIEQQYKSFGTNNAIFEKEDQAERVRVFINLIRSNMSKFIPEHVENENQSNNKAL